MLKLTPKEKRNQVKSTTVLINAALKQKCPKSVILDVHSYHGLFSHMRYRLNIVFQYSTLMEER